MNPVTFVSALKKSVQHGVEYELTQLYSDFPPNPPTHLVRFSSWLKGLSEDDKETAHDMMRFFAEGALFRILGYLDNRSQLVNEGGEFELWHHSQDGSRIRLNDPDGNLLNDLFDEVD